MGEFISLRGYACEQLGMSFKPKASDFEMQMYLGERYATVMSKSINERFNIIDFSCKNNGIVNVMHCVTNEGYLDIKFTKNPITNKMVFELFSNENDVQTTITEQYSDYKDFCKTITESLNK